MRFSTKQELMAYVDLHPLSPLVITISLSLSHSFTITIASSLERPNIKGNTHTSDHEDVIILDE